MVDQRAQRLINERQQLMRFKTMLDKDSVLPVRFQILKPSLDFTTFQITITGIRSLISKPTSGSSCTSSTFNLTWRLPVGYPWGAYPAINFEPPVPFHPHIFESGSICWGSANKAEPDLTLADWLGRIIEYLIYNQNSLVRMNPASPANRSANDWWSVYKSQLPNYVTNVDMNRIRFWIENTRG